MPKRYIHRWMGSQCVACLITFSIYNLLLSSQFNITAQFSALYKSQKMPRAVIQSKWKSVLFCHINIASNKNSGKSVKLFCYEIFTKWAKTNGAKKRKVSLLKPHTVMHLMMHPRASSLEILFFLVDRIRARPCTAAIVAPSGRRNTANPQDLQQCYFS